MRHQSVFAALMFLALATPAAAQQTYVQAPFHSAGSSYFERLGFGFGGTIGNNAFFNFGGVNQALPPFGGHDPSADARFGFGVRGNGFNLNVQGAAASGYSSSYSSTTPSLMLTNGVPGSIFSGVQRPFVTGLVPYVGHFSPGIGYVQRPPVVTSPLAERVSRMQDELARVAASPAPVRTATTTKPVESPEPAQTASTAQRGALSLRAIRAANAAADQELSAEIEAHLEDARHHEAAGELGLAAIHYGRAAAKARGDQQRQLRQKAAELRDEAKR
jgi:hypothetical protein